MILRRFMKHVTDQDWFAVGLDVIVVIVGIFLGLQVQAWYEDQANRVLEREYLAKLHTDTDQLIDIADDFTNSTVRIRDHMAELTQMLLDEHDGSDMNQLHCNSLDYSHIYVTRIVSLPTLNELLSSGQILLVQNEEIRSLISNFTLATDRTMMLLNSLQSDKLELSREFPETFKLKSIMAGSQSSFEDLKSECNYQLMLENDKFLNVLVGNNARYRAYVLEIQGQLTVLHQLHDALGAELGISHEESRI